MLVLWSVSFIGLWCRRVLSWSVCHDGYLVSVLYQVCGVVESCHGHAVCHDGSLVSVLYRFVV